MLKDLNIRLNPGGVVGALIMFFLVSLTLGVVYIQTGIRLGCCSWFVAFMFMSAGGAIGNAAWTVLSETTLVQYLDRKQKSLRGIVEVPDDDDEQSTLHPDKVARRREIADRWKQGRRLEDDDLDLPQ